MNYNLFFGYKKNEIIFNNMNIDIQENNVTVICGHNGAGKTTLMKLISGILPSSISNPDGWYVPASGGLIQYFSLNDHLKILGNKKDSPYIQELIKLFEIENLVNKKISKLSTGQVMICAIIVAIASEAKFLLFDEPFASLDPVNSEKLSGVFKRIVKDNKTVLITSHDLYLSSETADVIYFIKNGKISWNSLKEDKEKRFSVEELKERYEEYA